MRDDRLMKFVKRSHNNAKYVDNIFSIVNMCKADPLPSKVDGTAGCLRDETGKLFIYRTVFESEKEVSDIEKASYASSPAGNKDYIEKLSQYILDGRVDKPHGAIAAMGGTGAIYAAIKLCLDQNDPIIYPSIAWGNYRLMAEEFNLKALTYDIYDLDDLFAKIDSVERPFVVINSPCQNPCGHSYTIEEWDRIIDKLNSVEGEAILLNDNAYIDYSYGDSRKFMECFNRINDNVLVMMASSCSKSFSYYGVRMGALLAIHNDQEYIDSFINLASKLARTTWSNPNNGAMINLARVLDKHYPEFCKERDEAVAMLKRRTDLFIAQADEAGLEYYPYTEGFFVTLKFNDQESRDALHQKMIDSHIYTIKVNKGIRIGLCAIPLDKVDGLAGRIKQLKDNL